MCICLAHTVKTEDITSCREVWSLDMLHETVGIDVGVVNVCHAGVEHLAEVVCRDVCSHTHGNTR